MFCFVLIFSWWWKAYLQLQQSKPASIWKGLFLFCHCGRFLSAVVPLCWCYVASSENSVPALKLPLCMVLKVIAGAFVLDSHNLYIMTECSFCSTHSSTHMQNAYTHSCMSCHWLCSVKVLNHSLTVYSLIVSMPCFREGGLHVTSHEVTSGQQESVHIPVTDLVNHSWCQRQLGTLTKITVFVIAFITETDTPGVTGMHSLNQQWLFNTFLFCVCVQFILYTL